MTPDVRFRELFNAHYDKILAFSLRRSSDAEEAREVVAETFLVAWRRLSEVPAQAELPWLYGVARNCLYNNTRGELRRRRLEERLRAQPIDIHESADRDAADGASASGDQSGERVRAAMEYLRPSDAEILRLVEWEELSHAEIGVALEISENAVGIRVHRARKQLANLLRDQTAPDTAADVKGFERPGHKEEQGTEVEQ